MSVAVARRPVEQFETQVPVPDWQLSPEEEIFGDQALDANSMQPMMVDENGLPIGAPAMPDQGYPQQQPPMIRPDGTGDPTQQELDQAFPPPQQPQPQPQQRQPPPPQPRPQPPRQPQPQRDPLAPADAPQPRPQTA
jgi:penicillin-binding protein 1A